MEKPTDASAACSATDAARITALINRSPVVAVEWRNLPGWPVAFVSDGIAQWGYDRDDFLSGRIRYADLIHADDRPRIEHDVAEHLANGPDDYRQEYRIRTAAGTWVWLDDRTWLTRNERGEVTDIHGVLLDITATKAAEAEVRRLNATLEDRVAERTAQLQAANQELRSFSYTVSHDLKAPLRGIEGYSQLLLEQYRDRLDEDGRHFLTSISRGALHMHELIEDLLAYSRIERQALDVRSVALPAAVRGVLDGFAHEIQTRGVEVVVEELPPQVRTDPSGLTLVLRNLVSNALKFTRDTPAPRITISAYRHDRHIVLTVADNGVGFDMKYHDRIFEIFQRLHRAEDYPGTGIGLALVRKALQRMGGTVWAISEPGRGATFHVELRQ
ncbi:sensor histidine kinase [Aromatoleum petrolei]|uniref:histidine kinase n=1 Tax=Aromatoleum petrolei TaxID=76116 RepID=A0ABX1MJ59_9RHOO|nr:PAS domain-containing sensor histidine kinase [Aromatoleum petrolei]NMF87979.1 PAS domain-containing protein [Aromatoleum petrolei]QTQ36650.1 Putative two component system sensory histidine kinase [Aromatoleum petrolei]